MIKLSDRKWRSVRVDGPQSVEYLNRLFKSGWRLLRFDLQELPYLAFEIPDLAPDARIEEVEAVYKSLTPCPRIVVLILHLEASGPDQLAELLTRSDSRGRFDFGAVRTDLGVWQNFATIAIGTLGMLFLFEKHSGDGPALRTLQTPT